MMEKLNLTVRGKAEVFFQKECLSVSMVNEVGQFDILPEHANFISIVNGVIKVNESSGKTWKKECIRGIVRVASNMVDVVILEEKI